MLKILSSFLGRRQFSDWMADETDWSPVPADQTPQNWGVWLENAEICPDGSILARPTFLELPNLLEVCSDLLDESDRVPRIPHPPSASLASPPPIPKAAKAKCHKPIEDRPREELHTFLCQYAAYLTDEELVAILQQMKS